MKKEYYVYIYLDTSKPGKYVYGEYKFLHEPIYVGKGKRKRAYYYEKRNKYLKNKIKKIGKPIILIITKDLEESKAFELEKFLIALIGRKDLGKGPLCNFTDGGEGPSGNIRSKETRKKMSIAKKGRIVSEETRKKLSDINKGKVMPESVKEKIKNTLMGTHRSEKTKLKISLGHRTSMLDKSKSQTTRDKMRKANLGKTLSQTTRDKIGMAVRKACLERHKFQ
jgi:hypothetical protein